MKDTSINTSIKWKIFLTCALACGALAVIFGLLSKTLRQEPPAKSATAGAAAAASAAAETAPEAAPAAFPTRIVSLNPSITEILFALNAGDSVIGVTEFCTWPPEAQNLPRVGGFSGATVNIEAIAEMRPDLVLVSSEMHFRVVSLLERLGVKTAAFEPHTFSEVYETIREIGALTGHGSEAEAVVSGMQAKIDEVSRDTFRVTEKDMRPGVFWELWSAPLQTCGKDSLINEVITLAGGRSIFDDLPGQWPQVSPEEVVLRQPDWIMAASDLPLTLDALRSRPLWNTIPAVRHGRLALLPADPIQRWGPRLADAVLDTALILNH